MKSMNGFFSLVLSFSFFYSGFSEAAWNKNLPPLKAPLYRSYIHMHSVHSHDACDEKPKNKQGQINEKCLNDFRQTLCNHNVDVVALTEHRNEMARMNFNDILEARPGDEKIYDQSPISGEEKIVGLKIQCEDNRQVLVLPGSENELMAVGLADHPVPPPGKTLEETYNMRTADTGPYFREAGALLGISHLEDKSDAESVALAPDFVEAYNLHANLKSIYKSPDKKISKTLGTLGRVLRFLVNPFIQPDLIFLTFFKEDKTTLDRWAKINVANGKTPGVFGTDGHQNALKLRMYDHERIDSYRRVLRWFSNYLVIDEGLNRNSVLKAISQGNSYGVFEVFGSPEGFQFSANVDNQTNPMGSRVELNPGLTLHVQKPTLDTQGQAAPAIHQRILKATDQGWIEMARSSEPEMNYPVSASGIYRAEVRIVPHHLKKQLKGHKSLIKEYPWIYSNPIQVD